MDDLDDLYGDVAGIGKKIESRDELQAKIKALEGELTAANDKLSKSEKLKKGLEKQNEVLKKNISVLFKTAQTELDRKTDEIRQLRRRLESNHQRPKQHSVQQTNAERPQNAPITS